MRKKLLIALGVLLALAVVNLAIVAVVQSRRAAERERYITQLEEQLARAQAPAPASQRSPVELILRAIERGDIQQVRAQLDGHPELINTTTDNPFGSTPLQYAAYNNQPEIAAELIKRGANVNAVNKDGRTPLHDAITAGSPSVVALLLKHGADVHLQTKAGKDPAAYATERKRPVIVEMIRQHEQTTRVQ